VADESPAAFYDGLASEYHSLYPDWWAGAQWHADVIDGVLRSVGVSSPAPILDCACGIGTQAIPLAQRGYVMTATDISEQAIARAKHEAVARDISLSFGVADMRQVHEVVTPPFHAVIACDNAIPHLLDDADLDAALSSIASCLAPGGVFLASVRDYDVLRRDRVAGVPGVVRQRADGREIVGQAWEWSADFERMRIHLFVLHEHAPDQWTTTVHRTWYRALGRTALAEALHRAGFDDIRWHEPADSGYYQPIVTARRPGVPAPSQ
jgi:glycine/sarcosine N-methyltransferase